MNLGVFFIFLVEIYTCLNVKSIKNVCAFGTKEFYLINNHTHHGKKQPHIYYDACMPKETEPKDIV